MRTFYNLQRVELGYAKEHLLMVKVDVQTAGYEEQRRPALFERLFQRVSATPGVRTATYSKSGFFLGSDSGDEVLVEGYTRKGDNDRGSRYDHVGPNFFSTLGIPILLGREITNQDQPSSTRVCVINEALAKQFFAGRNPLGMHITQVFDNQRNTYQIVGVAKNSRKRSLRGEVEPRFFVPMSQPIEMPNFVTFALRTAAEPASVIAGVRRAILSEDSNLPIPIARPLEDAIDERMLQDRILARLSLGFGCGALLLAAIGLYGVLSYGVTRRTNEIGIRKALGAQHGAVIAMILRETGLLLSVGLMVGVGLSVAAVRLIASRLYGLAPTDPLAMTMAVVLLGGVALLAGWLPARRASRVDPLVALRYQ
jgi:predicted permease